MGTNYYLKLKKKYNQKEGLPYFKSRVQELENGWVFNNIFYETLEDLNKDYYIKYHIGKNSSGWHFLLCLYPEDGINSLKDWEKLFNDSRSVIVDEYDDIIIDPKVMLNLIKNKQASELMMDQTKENKYPLGKNGLYKHTSSMVKDNNTDGTYDTTLETEFS